MNQEIVSVIIPAYNTDCYIERMIKCLLSQTYSSLQIVFVDDGSTDSTAEIIKNYQKKDKRIEYYYQANAGVSYARNYGLSKAIGKKIFFFDSDDTFLPTLIEECMIYAEESDVESVLYGYGNKVNGVIEMEHSFQLHGIYRGSEIANKVMPSFLGHSYVDVNRWLLGKCGQREGKEHTALWRIMLDASVIRDNHIRFDPNLSIGEDTKFINTYMLFTSSIAVLEKTLYYLTIREGSANVMSNENPILMAQNKEKLITARKEIDTIARKKGIDTNGYWQGTLILSAVQLAIKLSRNKSIVGMRGSNRKCFYHYLSNEDVQKAIKNYHPIISIKAIPFVMLKLHLEWLLYGICSVIPQSVIGKLV